MAKNVTLKGSSLVTVVVKWVVAGKGQKHTKPWAQREEDLRSCVYPYLPGTERQHNKTTKILKTVN